MAGLVQYASSDEESDQEEVPQSPEVTCDTQNGAPEPQPAHTPQPVEAPRIEEAPSTHAAPGPAPGPARPPPDDVVIGPSRPAAADMAVLPSLDDDDDDASMADAATNGNGGDPPLSPYSAERAAVRQLTMPRVPDFDIPGGGDDDGHDNDDDDDAQSAAVNKKFATFLELKKKSTHFNARLAQSDAMKNPALMDKLMAFVGLPGCSTDQDAKGAVDTAEAAAPYATTLPAAIWDPAAFPAEAYRRSLRRLQEEAAKQRARAPGEPVNFVAATAAATADAPAGKRKSRFD